MFLSVAPWTSNRQDCFNCHPNWPPCAKATDQMGWRGQLKGIKTGEWGLTGLTSPCPWAERKSSPSFVWNPWRNKGPIRIGQSTGEILKERLKDCGLFTKDNLFPTFWILEERVLQGKEAKPHYYKSPNTSSHQGTHNWPFSSTLELWEYF